MNFAAGSAPETGPGQAGPSQKSLWLKIGIPAAVLILAGASYYFYQIRRIPNSAGANFILSASDSNTGGISPDAGFILKSSVNLNPAQVGKIVKFQPAISFAVKKNSDGTFLLKPDQPLAQEKIYVATVAQGVADHDYSWAYQVRAPFGVLATTPADRGSAVPINTGVEITFNRERTGDIQSYFKIEPEVRGTFEPNGETMIFKPQQLLQAETIYTVTVKKGLPLADGSESLADDYVFRFQTSGISYPGNYIDFPTDFTEFLPSAKPVLNIYASNDQAVQGSIYQYSDLNQFLDSYKNSRDWDFPWLKGPQDTYFEKQIKPHKLISSFTIKADSRKGILELPSALAPGYYVFDGVVLGHHNLVWLQISALGHYATYSYDNSLVWIYDLSAMQAGSGAELNYQGNKLGTADSNGLVKFATPADLKYDPQQSRLMFSPIKRDYTPKFLIAQKNGYPAYAISLRNINAEQPSSYWQFLATDRPLYQLTDQVKFWGVLKNRDNKPLPEKVQVVLAAPESYDWLGDSTAGSILVSTEVPVQKSGDYQGHLDFKGLDPRYYVVETLVDGRVVSTVSVNVTTYAKPTYQLDVQAEKPAYFAGDQAHFKIHASFYDGSPVSGLKLSYQAGDLSGKISTDGSGNADVLLTIPYDPKGYFPSSFVLNVNPAEAEESGIQSFAFTTVFGPHFLMQSEAHTRENGGIQASVKLNNVDLAKYAEAACKQDSKQCAGAQVPGVNVRAAVHELTWTQKQVGSYYDYISKTVQPIYDYQSNDSIVDIDIETTNGSGEAAFNRQIAVRKDASYSIEFAAIDQFGRTAKDTDYLYFSEGGYDYMSRYSGTGPVAPYLQINGQQYSSDQLSVNDDINLSLVKPQDFKSAANVLYYRFQRNIDNVWISSDPNQHEKFASAFAPEVSYVAVAVTPYGFVPTEPVYAYYKINDSNLDIKIKPDQESFKPGDKVHFSVSVKDKNGNPVSGRINIAVVDKSLLDLAGSLGYYNADTDLLQSLYEYILVPPDTDFTQYSPPADEGDGKGGGGGDDGTPGRVNFKDTAFFNVAQLDSFGTADFQFDLPDNVTQWQITARAFSPDRILGGTASKLVSAELPFFAGATMNGTYLAGDQPVIKVRLGGKSYDPNQNSTAEIKIPELNFSGKTVFSGGVGALQLPKLPAGSFTMQLSASQGPNKDVLSRPFAAVASYFSKPVAVEAALHNGDNGLSGAKDRSTQLFFSDEVKGLYFQELSFQNYLPGFRADQRAAQYFAAKTLHDQYGVGSEPEPLDLSSFIKSDGYALLSYGSADLAATAQLAALLPENVSSLTLRNYFYTTISGRNADVHQTSKALFGLAFLNEPVLQRVEIMKGDPNLNLEDKLYVAAALAKFGDKEAARKMYFDQIRPNFSAENNQLWFNTEKDQTKNIKLTSLGGLLATQLRLGDDAKQIWNFLGKNFPVKDNNYLEKDLIIKEGLGGVDKNYTASFDYTLNGQNKHVDLKNSEGFALTVLPDDLGKIRFSNVRGNISVTSTSVQQAAYADLNSKTAAITRTYLVGGQKTNQFHEGDLIEVQLRLDDNSALKNNDYAVIDHLPSGLKPAEFGSPNFDSGCTYYPDEIRDNSVSFTIAPAYPGSKCKIGNTTTFHYFARISSLGQFKADPAEVFPADDKNDIAVSGSDFVTITP